MQMKSKQLEEIAQSIERIQAKRIPAIQTTQPKTTQTPFGLVWSKLLPLKHNKALRKGEILAQWIRDKKTGKREKFVWLGIVENSIYDSINNRHIIYYRPFVLQDEKVKEREEQIWTRQMA